MLKSITPSLRIKRLFQKDVLIRNHKSNLSRIQKRCYYLPEEGETWTRQTFPDPNLQQYVVSFTSRGRQFHLLGIIPGHEHSNLLIDNFIKAMAPQKPTVVLPTHKEERLELDDVEHDFIPFFDSLYSLDYADAYVESKTNFIRDISTNSSMTHALYRAAQNDLPVIKTARDPVISVQRFLRQCYSWQRRKHILAIDKNSLSKKEYLVFVQGKILHDKRFLDLYETAVDSRGIFNRDSEYMISRLEPAAIYTHYLKSSKNNNVIGILNAADIYTVMNLMDVDLADWDELLTKDKGFKASLSYLHKHQMKSMRHLYVGDAEKRVKDLNKKIEREIERAEQEEAQKQKELAEKAQKEAEEQAQKEAEEQAQKDVQEQAQKEAEEQSQKDVEEQASKIKETMEKSENSEATEVKDESKDSKDNKSEKI